MNVTGVGTMSEAAVASGKSEDFGYTFCDGCNEVPFCAHELLQCVERGVRALRQLMNG